MHRNVSTRCRTKKCKKRSNLQALALITTTHAQTADFGDAPASYDAGTPANHTVVTGVQLGAAADTEAAAQPNATATGDDTAGATPDDEDGVAAFSPLTTGATSYSVTAGCRGAGATVAGWVDFDGSGTFDVAERVQTTCTGSVATLNWTGLNVTATGTTYARLRIASNAAEVANPTGAASDGEVED